MSNQDLKTRDIEAKESGTVESKKQIDFIRILLILIGVLCIGIAGFQLFHIFMDYQKGDDTYTKIEEEFVVVQPQQEDEKEEVEVPWYELASVDVARIQEKYADVIGWIFFEKEDINYPIMQGKDNEEYLHTAYNGQTVKAGSIYMDYRASTDFSDSHTIVYGHNMGNLSMFGRLRFYRNYEGYYDDHMYFQIFTDEKILRYQIFSYQVVSSTSFVYQRNHTSVVKLVDKLMKSAIDGTYLDITEEDKIMTLSTCTNADDKERLIVNAVLVDEYEIENK